MVNDKLHIICGNCGEIFSADKNNAELDFEENNEDVYIICNNCGTLHIYVKNAMFPSDKNTKKK